MDNDGLASSTELYTKSCSCRRTFNHPAALKNHQNSCLIFRDNVSTALDGARKVLGERKLKRKEQIFNNLNPGGSGSQLVKIPRPQFPSGLHGYHTRQEDNPRHSYILKFNLPLCTMRIHLSLVNVKESLHNAMLGLPCTIRN